MTTNALAEPVAKPTGWFDADPEIVRERFDRAAFAFRHRLATHPLFAPGRIAQLAKDLSALPDGIYCDVGDVRVDQRWDQAGKPAMPIEEVLRRVETAGAWILLRKAEADPEYAALLAECIDEISTLAGRDFSKVMKLRNAIMFISSPNRVSSYHIDRECNCLLQIRGSKTVRVFDRDDRTVLPEEEIERFWAVDSNAALYKPSLEGRGTAFELNAGDAVHIPVNAPHWVQNGPEVSISLSVNFHYRDDILGDVYRMNYWMRRLGLKPTPPRIVPATDAVKRTIWGIARVAKTTTARIARRQG